MSTRSQKPKEDSIKEEGFKSMNAADRHQFTDYQSRKGT